MTHSNWKKKIQNWTRYRQAKSTRRLGLNNIVSFSVLNDTLSLWSGLEGFERGLSTEHQYDHPISCKIKAGAQGDRKKKCRKNKRIKTMKKVLATITWLVYVL